MNKYEKEGKRGKLRRVDASREGKTVRGMSVSIDIVIAGDRVLENQSKPHNTINRGHTCLVYPRKR